MKTLSFPHSPLVLVALILVVSLKPLLADEVEVEVVDPISGETVDISEIDVDALTDEQRKEVGDQLAAQGVNPGGGQGQGGRGGPRD